MPVSVAYKSFILDLLSDFGPVSIRHMFSGAGVYADGVMFAILAEDTLYLKADISKPTRFRRAPSPPKGKAPSPIVRRTVARSLYHIGRFPNGCSTTLRSLWPGRDGRTPWHLPPRPRGADPIAPECSADIG